MPATTFMRRAQSCGRRVKQQKSLNNCPVFPQLARSRHLMRCSELSGQIGAVETPARRSAELTTSMRCFSKTGGIRFERIHQDLSC